LASVAGRLEGVPVRLAKRLPDWGATVYSMGHTYGYFHTLTKGIVSHVDRHINGRRVLQVSAQGGPGNSGGPLFNERGELVGVVVGGPVAPLVGNFGGTVVNHMALCEPLQHIRNFLAKYGAL
jgi:S1-C subfamily serine protease